MAWLFIIVELSKDILDIICSQENRQACEWQDIVRHLSGTIGALKFQQVKPCKENHVRDLVVNSIVCPSPDSIIYVFFQRQSLPVTSLSQSRACWQL